MVDLVLDHTRRKPLGLDLDPLTVLVLGAHPHPGVALDLDMHARQAQTALFGRLELVALPLEHRVHKRCQRVLGVGAVDEHTVQHAELGGGQPDAERVVHQLPHPLDLSLQHLVEALDRQRRRAQHGITELAHLAQRRVAAGTSLRIELLGLGRILLALDLDVGILRGRGRQLLERVLLERVVLCGHRCQVYEEQPCLAVAACRMAVAAVVSAAR